MGIIDTTIVIAIDPIIDATVIKITTDHIEIIITIDTIVLAAIIQDAATTGIAITINSGPDPASGPPGIRVAKLSVRVYGGDDFVWGGNRRSACSLISQSSNTLSWSLSVPSAIGSTQQPRQGDGQGCWRLGGSHRWRGVCNLGGTGQCHRPLGLGVLMAPAR